MENVEIRRLIAINLLKHWEVANKLNISDSTFSRWLRIPLNDEKQKRVFEAIEELKKEVI